MSKARCARPTCPCYSATGSPHDFCSRECFSGSLLCTVCQHMGPAETPPPEPGSCRRRECPCEGCVGCDGYCCLTCRDHRPCEECVHIVPNRAKSIGSILLGCCGGFEEITVRCFDVRCPCDAEEGREFCSAVCRQGKPCQKRMHHAATTTLYSNTSAASIRYDVKSEDRAARKMLKVREPCSECKRHPAVTQLDVCERCMNSALLRIEARLDDMHPSLAVEVHVDRHRPFFELSNAFPCAITMDGATYPTVEHFMCAAPFLPAQPRIADAIRRAPLVLTAREEAYKNATLQRSDWASLRTRWMSAALREKFMEPHMREALRLTRGRYIVCRSESDGFWGRSSTGEGENRLGKFLIELRDEL